MNLVRWFRKNNKKVLAVVVIFIMIAFIMPTFLQQLSRPGARGSQVTAYTGKEDSITTKDIALADQDLNILKMMRADTFLLISRDLRAQLLGQLLFPEPTMAAILNTQYKQLAVMHQLRVSPKQIDDFFAKARGQKELYWFLLKREAAQAGCAFSNEQAGRVLATIIPQISQGQYGASTLLQAIVDRAGVTEERILQTFADMLAVLAYARAVTSPEDVTLNQMMNQVSRQKETIDVEYVKFDASVFAASQPQPAEEELLAHFEKYKKYFSDQLAEKNPSGFGYKQPDRLRLEYLVIKQDDVAKQIAEPTDEETSDYYQNHLNEFAYAVPADTNDPNSAMVQLTKNYAEVVETIKNTLLQQKTNFKSDIILNELRETTEAGLLSEDLVQADSKKFKALAGDYAAAAKKIGGKYNIEIYSGKTSLLNAKQLAEDKYLGVLLMDSQSSLRLPLVKIAFAVDELGASVLGPFEVAKPRMYENIGPLKDEPREITAVVRVIETEKAYEPGDMNPTYTKSSIELDKEQTTPEDTYSLREQVVSDYKKLKAMAVTKAKAEEFIKLAAEKSWDNAIDKFNSHYDQKETENQTTKAFETETLTDVQRFPKRAQNLAESQLLYNPHAREAFYKSIKHKALIDQLNSLIPTGQATVADLPVIMEFKPHTSYYVIKDISRKQFSQAEFNIAKASVAFTEEFVQSQSFAIIHFNPENISKRMNFRRADQKSEDTEPNDTQ